MANWAFYYEEKNFDVNDYVPLDGDFDEPFHFHVKYRFFYHSEIYHNDNDHTIEVEGDIVGYDPRHNHPSYPCIIVNLGFENGQEDARCGVLLRAQCYDYNVQNVIGVDTDNEAHTSTLITTGNYGDRFVAYYTTNAWCDIIESNIPVIFQFADPDLFGANLWYTGNSDSSLNLDQYDPDSDPITDEILGTAVNCINNTFDKETGDYYIYNAYQTADVEMGIVEYVGEGSTTRCEKFKANSKPVLYYVDKDNSFELELIANDVVGSCYSSISKADCISKARQAQNWTKPGLYYDNPWYAPYELSEDGEYIIGIYLDTNILIFSDEESARGYLRGEVPAEDAINYGKINKPQIAENETGTKETITTFGGNESENVFSHDYLMSRSELATVGGKFFDTNIITALLEGLKVYGNNPMESVLSCLYFPFDLTTICNSTSVTDIYFGSYKMENVSAKKVSTRSGYKELGSTYIKPTFYNWLDYKAAHIYLYLPYIGFVELDINKYLDKTLKIIYMVDLHSGECEVSLCANGLLMDTYSGQIGIKQPVTYNDLSTYFTSQITALRNGVMSAVGMPLGGTIGGAQTGAAAGPYGAAAGAMIGGTVGAIGGKAAEMWTAYSIRNTTPPLFSKGGYSSEIGANMPQYAFLVFLYNDIQEPDNLLDLYGKPSNRSGYVGNFSGFLSTFSVNLRCARATDAEKAEIVSLLTQGIYI